MTPLDIDRLRRAFPGRTIEYYSSIDSTMHAAAGLGFGGIVLAEEQTNGQGRLGRTWHSEPGAGIYCSVVLRPTPVLTLALGLAAQAAISEAGGVECDLRWPNDLMVGEKKVGGILVQLAGEKAVAGIGINVYQAPRGLEDVATCLSGTDDRFLRPVGRPDSLRQATNTDRLSDRESILMSLLPAIDRFTSLSTTEVLRLFTASSTYARGRRVVVQQPDVTVEGVTAGLDPSGFLIVRRDDGTDTLILAGGVRAARS